MARRWSAVIPSGPRPGTSAVAEFSLDRVVAATLAVYQRLSATAVS